tara:strand:- start:538 stop:1272 length:735 start_codon:yes stop_codon:yes gene_type:complete
MLGIGTNIIKADLYSSVSQAAYFDGDDLLFISDDDTLSFTSSTGFGVSVWVNIATLGNHGIFNKDEEYNFLVRDIGGKFQWEFTVIDDSEDKYHIGIGVHPVSSHAINEWVHIIAEYNTSKTVKCYINNFDSTASATQSGFVESENTTGILSIGRASDAPGPNSTSNAPLTGAITNLCIYSGILTSTERNDIYNAGVGGVFTDHSNNTVAAYLPLTSNSSDISGNNNNAQSAPVVATHPTFTTI